MAIVDALPEENCSTSDEGATLARESSFDTDISNTQSGVDASTDSADISAYLDCTERLRGSKTISV